MVILLERKYEYSENLDAYFENPKNQLKNLGKIKEHIESNPDYKKLLYKEKNKQKKVELHLT